MLGGFSIQEHRRLVHSFFERKWSDAHSPFEASDQLRVVWSLREKLSPASMIVLQSTLECVRKI